MISSPGNPAIKTLKKLKHRKYRRRMDQFLVDDVDVFQEAVKSGHRPEHVYSCTNLPFLEEFYPAEVKESLLAPISDMVSFSGFIAIFSAIVPDAEREDDRVVVLDGIQDPANVGAILRCAVQFGITGAWLNDDCADPFSLRALRAAKGGTFNLQVLRLGKQELELRLEKPGRTIYAADTKGGEALGTVVPSQPFALVMGNEGEGISDELREQADVRVTIPGTGAIESLNVAVAAGIILYQFSSKLPATASMD